MEFAWPTQDQVRYRLLRLRRVIVAAALIPFAAFAALYGFDPETFTAERAVLALFVVGALVIGHVVLFPNMAEETLSLSLAATGLTVAMPFLQTVAQWAPAEHATAALILLIAVAVVATGVLVGVIHLALNLAIHAGRPLGLRITTRATLPCSPHVARQQCALQPNTRRGRVLSGPADQNGFFEVAVLSYQMPHPAAPDRPLVVSVDAKVLQSDAAGHDVMIALRNGTVTVSAQRYRATPEGCELTVSDLPGDFTAGMHIFYWLTDQQADNLTELTDVITGTDVRANGLAHGVSLLSVAGAILLPKRPTETTAD